LAEDLSTADLGGLYDALYDSRFRPNRSPSGLLQTVKSSEGTAFILKSTRTGEFFEIDATSAEVWNLMDGSRSLRQITKDAAKVEPGLSLDDVKDIILTLAEAGLVAGTEPKSIRKKRARLVSAFQVNLVLLWDSGKSLAGLFKLLKPFFRRELLIGTLFFTVAIVALFAGRYISILENRTSFEVNGSTLLGMLFYNMLILLPVYAIHELAHAAACEHYGARPGEIGTGLFYFAPMFYCDTSDSWRLPRKARIMVSLSGPIITAFVGALLVVWSYLTPEGFPRTVLTLAAFFSFYGTITNFSPVIETDGYYALMDATGIPNLRDEAFSYLKSITSKIFGIKRGDDTPEEARVVRILQLYSVAAAAWLAFFLYSTVRITYYLSQDAWRAVLVIARDVLSFASFNSSSFIVSIASVVYFLMLLSGYALMGKTLFVRIRGRGMKLETVHDKVVAISMPIPRTLSSESGGAFLAKLRSVALKSGRAVRVQMKSSVCVVLVGLGRSKEDFMTLGGRMRNLESRFRREYEKLLKRVIQMGSAHVSVVPGQMECLQLIRMSASHLPGFKRGEASSRASEYVRGVHTSSFYALDSSFGSIWSLEIAPTTFEETKHDDFTDLLIEDISLTDLYADLEEFKKSRVIGLDSLAYLASSLEAARKRSQSSRRIQAMTLVEPIRGRIIFIGRTEKVERSLAKLAEIFYFQSWSGYIDWVLYECTLQLSTIRLSPALAFGSSSISKLRSNELVILEKDFELLKKVLEQIQGAPDSLKARHDEAESFYDSIAEEVDPKNDNFDVGMFRPILEINSENLASIKERIPKLKVELSFLAEKLQTLRSVIDSEYASRKEAISSFRARMLRNGGAISAVSLVGLLVSYLLGASLMLPLGLFVLVNSILWGVLYPKLAQFRRTPRLYTQEFDRLEKILLASGQSLYPLVLANGLL
jgi:hypothetical protein